MPEYYGPRSWVFFPLIKWRKESLFEASFPVLQLDPAPENISRDSTRVRGIKVIPGIFPENIPGTVQYGHNLEALAVSLNTVGLMGIKPTHDILSAVLGIPMSTGTLIGMVRSYVQNLNDTVKRIRNTVFSLPMLHFDETAARVEKKTLWVHIASNPDFTCLTFEGKLGRPAKGGCPAKGKIRALVDRLFEYKGGSLPIYQGLQGTL